MRQPTFQLAYIPDAIYMENCKMRLKKKRKKKRQKEIALPYISPKHISTKKHRGMTVVIKGIWGE